MKCQSLFLLVPLVVAMATCYVAGEFYPLSDFPMYSKFDDRTYLVYLKSPDGTALSTVQSLGMPSSQLKKRYGAELNELKTKYSGSHFSWTLDQKCEAAEKTIKYLRETFNPSAFANKRLDGVQLIDVRLQRIRGGIVRAENVIATVNEAGTGGAK